MINFSLEEIIRSILYASSFGILFSFLYTAIRLLKSILLTIPDVIRELFVFDRLFCTPDFKKSMLLMKNGRLMTFISILLFSLGLVTVSYLSLDGEIRIYVIVFSFASFYLANIVFLRIFLKVIIFILDLLLRVICIALRMMIFPFRKLFSKKRA